MNQPIKMPSGPQGRLRCTMRLAKEPVTALREWRARYGETFWVPLVGGIGTVMTCEPELIRQIHGNRDLGVFAAGVREQIDPLFGARSTFARYEAAIVLGTLLREFEFELLDEHVEWNRGKLILEPLGGINMRVKARARLQAAA